MTSQTKKIRSQRCVVTLSREIIIIELVQIDEDLLEDDLEANLMRDKHARLCSLVGQLIDEMTPSAPDFQLREACDQLVRCLSSAVIFTSLISQMSVLVDVPEMQGQLVSAHGMLAIVEVLEGKASSRDVVNKLLQIVNLVSFYHLP